MKASPVYGLFFGDIHIHGVNEFSQPVEGGLTDLHVKIRNSLFWVAEQIKIHKPLWVVCMGDVFHVPGFVDSASLSVAWDGFSEIADAVKKSSIYPEFDILVGNHDTSIVKDGQHVLHSIPFLGGMLDGVANVIQSPQIRELCIPPKTKKSALRHRALFIPYTDDYDAVQKRVQEEVKAGAIDFVATHVDALDTMWNAGKASTIGVSTNLAKEVGVPIFNGHHHHPEEKDGWVNVGSLMYRSFQDSIVAQPRGVVLFHENRTTSRVENPHTDLFHTIRSPNVKKRWEEMSNHPQSKRVNLRVIATPEETDEIIKEKLSPTDDAESLPSFNRVKFIRSGAKKQVERLQGLHETSSPEDLFRAYAEKEQIDSDVVEECLARIKDAMNLDGGPRVDIEFVEGSCRNFMSFDEQHIDLTGTGVRLVDGKNLDSTAADSNGSGKSSLLEILAWVFYSRTLRGAKNAEVIRNGQKAVEASVTFRKGEHEYVVTRGWDPTGGSLKLSVDGEDVTQHLRKDTQKKVEEALGLSELDFFQVCYLDLSRRFSTLSDAEKKALIERISGGPVFALAHESVKTTRKKENVDERYRQLQTDFNAARSRYEQQVQTIEQYSQNRESRVDKIKAALSKQQLKRSSLEESLKLEEQNYIDTKKRYAETKAKADPSALVEKTRAIESKISSLEDKILELRKAAQTYRVEEKNKEALEEGQCPTCGQDVKLPDNHVMHLAILRQKIDKHDEAIHSYQEKISRLRSDLQMVGDARYDLLKQLSEVEADLSNQRHRIEGIKKELVHTDELVVSLTQEQQEIQSAIDHMQSVLVSLSDSLTASATEFDKVAKRLQLLGDMEFHLGPEGVRSYATDRSLFALNAALVRMGQDFGGEISVQVVPERANKSGTGMIQRIELEVQPTSYIGLSKGERRRVDLLIQLALRECLESSRGDLSLLVSDECDDGLDETGIKGLFDLFDGMDKRVFFITHNPIARGFCTDVLTVVKQNGISSVEG